MGGKCRCTVRVSNIKKSLGKVRVRTNPTAANQLVLPVHKIALRKHRVTTQPTTDGWRACIHRELFFKPAPTPHYAAQLLRSNQPLRSANLSPNMNIYVNQSIMRCTTYATATKPKFLFFTAFPACCSHHSPTQTTAPQFFHGPTAPQGKQLPNIDTLCALEPTDSLGSCVFYSMPTAAPRHQAKQQRAS
jgi:hypothetical protein